MSRGPQTFRQSDLTRAIKGAQAAGIAVARITIAKDGKIEIDTGSAPEAETNSTPGEDQWSAALK